MSVPNTEKCACHPSVPVTLSPCMSRCPWQASVRLTSSGPGTRPSHLPTPDAAPNPAPDLPPWPVFRRGCGRGRRVEPAMLCCSKESQKHRGGGGCRGRAGSGGPPGDGPCHPERTRRFPSGISKHRTLWGVCHPEGDRLSRQGRGGGGEGAQEAFCRSREGAERRRLVAGGLGRPKAGWARDLVSGN